MITYVFFSGILALVVVVFLIWDILRRPISSSEIRELSARIRSGARTFVRNEYLTAGPAVLLAAGILWLVPRLFHTGAGEAGIGLNTVISFVFGAVASGLSGFVAMNVATQANGRTTEAAAHGLRRAFQVAYSSGAVTGLAVSGIAVLGLLLVYILCRGELSDITGYAMGASLMALFARSGGGIYTKGADMGADLVGKVEAGIPEDDPRNPAVIADNVGDNVGDINGLGADLMESFVEAIISAMAIATTLSHMSENAHWTDELVFLPLIFVAWGLAASVIGVIWIRFGPVRSAQTSLNMGMLVSTTVMLVGSFFIVRRLGINYVDHSGSTHSVYAPFWALATGVGTGLIIAAVSLYYTGSQYSPTRKLAESAKSGTAVLIVGGLNLGMISTWVPGVAVGIATLVCHSVAGIYGIATGALGMLSTLTITLSVDSYGPVVDNAGGIAEMTGQDEKIRAITDSLDSVGNTTAAIGKGFAIGSAAFAALALITAYVHTINHYAAHPISLTLSDPGLLAGLILGGTVPFFFSSLLGKSVVQVADRVVTEVRRQFRESPGLLEGTAQPDSDICVEIASRGALRGILLPGILAVVIPGVIGFGFGPVALAGLVMGALISGLPLAIFMANTGGAWDNAKKYIEEGRLGGKNSDAHKATVTADTVGDPLKDTMGPSINILIKLMSITALLLAPELARLAN